MFWGTINNSKVTGVFKEVKRNWKIQRRNFGAKKKKKRKEKNEKNLPPDGEGRQTMTTVGITPSLGAPFLQFFFQKMKGKNEMPTSRSSNCNSDSKNQFRFDE